MLHFHGFEHQEELAFAHRVAGRNVGGEDVAGHRGGEAAFDFQQGRQRQAWQFDELHVEVGAVGEPAVAILGELDLHAAAVDGHVRGGVVSGEHGHRARRVLAHRDGKRAVALGSVLHGHFRVAVPERHPLRRHGGVAPAAADVPQHAGVGAAGGLAGDDGGDHRVRQGVWRDWAGARRVHALDEVRGGVAGEEGRLAQGGDEEIAVVAQAVQRGLFQGAGEFRGGFPARGGVGDHLGDHRVELHGDAAAGFHAGVEAGEIARGGPPHVDGARRRQEAARRVFGVEARFNGVAGDGEILLAVAECLAFGDAQLFTH